MSFNINVKGGKSVRLPTGGKYCDRDIVITADGTDLPELSSPGTATDLMAGKQLIDGEGKVVNGSFTLEEEITTQDSLIARIKSALLGKVTGGNALPTQEKTVAIAQNGTHEIVPDDGYALSKATVTVNVPIPDGYIKPVGTLEVTENGIHDVTAYQSVNVNVAGSAPEDPRDQYQRVEYIESAETGTYPYIITDFYADNSCGVELIASFPTLVDRIPMGSRENGDPTRFYCVYPLSANSIYYGFDTGVTISCKLTINTVYRLQTNFLNSRLVNVYDANGTRKGGGSISDTLTQQTAPVSIFGYNYASSGAVSSKREFKLYSARCSRGHEVVREYIPCYRKSDGVVGVYEKFTRTFLTAETGAFAKGADVEW